MGIRRVVKKIGKRTQRILCGPEAACMKERFPTSKLEGASPKAPEKLCKAHFVFHTHTCLHQNIRGENKASTCASSIYCCAANTDACEPNCIECLHTGTIQLGLEHTFLCNVVDSNLCLAKRMWLACLQSQMFDSPMLAHGHHTMFDSPMLVHSHHTTGMTNPASGGFNQQLRSFKEVTCYQVLNPCVSFIVSTECTTSCWMPSVKPIGKRTICKVSKNLVCLNSLSLSLNST